MGTPHWSTGVRPSGDAIEDTQTDSGVGGKRVMVRKILGERGAARAFKKGAVVVQIEKGRLPYLQDIWGVTCCKLHLHDPWAPGG